MPSFIRGMWLCHEAVFDEAIELIKSHGATAILEDHREDRKAAACWRSASRGNCDGHNCGPFDALVAHDNGVLAATTAFGKTVVAAALIAHRTRNTLILVHRRELLTQWVERLTFLSDD